MARGDMQINLNVPAELKLRLQEIAALNKRSLTSEIIGRLETSLQAEEVFSQAENGDPAAMVLSAVDTITTASNVIKHALIKLGVENGRINVPAEGRKYEITPAVRALQELIVSIDEDTRLAILKLFQKQ
jgi:hypothetical protein